MTLVKAWILAERDDGGVVPIMEDFPHIPGPYQQVATAPPRPI